MPKLFTVTKREDKPELEVELQVELPWEAAAAKRAAAVRELSEAADFPGFRPGLAPETLVVAKFGQKAVDEGMAFRAIRDVFPEIIASEKIVPLVEPKITVTKLAAGNPVEFKVALVQFPQITLPDYKALALGIERRATTPTDDEVSAEIERVRRAAAHQGHGHADGEKCEHDDAAPLPPLTDEEAAKMGPFKSVDELRAKVAELVTSANEYRDRDRRRRAIVEAVVAGAKPVLPKVIVDRELDRMRAEFQHSIERVGLTWDKYLAQAEKSEESLRDEWRDEARIRAASHLILPMIAREENLVVNDALVDKETDALVARQPGTSRVDARAYIEHLVRNDLVLAHLEDLDRRGAKKE
jgi:FKBP-type peptidyl-prolyl cis-trans isomerase (trigger factor)